MIKYIKRKDIDVEKYDDCIENSLQSRIYAFSWYLDIVADNWGVLVLDDYQAVMPLPWRKKYGIKYVYPPFWVLELGVFSKKENLNLALFLKVLYKKNIFIESRLNSDNAIKEDDKFLQLKKIQLLPIDNEYDVVFKNYRKDRRKDLLKAKKNKLTAKWKDQPDVLLDLFKNNVGKRISNIKASDYNNLKEVIQTCIKKQKGEVVSVYDASEKVVASGFFLKHNKTITILVSSTDFKNRNNGANTFLIDTVINYYCKKASTFNFGGSSMETIAKYFLSFGSSTYTYQQVSKNFLKR